MPSHSPEDVSERCQNLRTRNPQKLIYAALQEASKVRKKRCTKSRRFRAESKRATRDRQSATKLQVFDELLLSRYEYLSQNGYGHAKYAGPCIWAESAEFPKAYEQRCRKPNRNLSIEFGQYRGYNSRNPFYSSSIYMYVLQTGLELCW